MQQSSKKTAYRKAWEFFYANAGYSVAQNETKRQGRARCARQMARAEQQAANAGLTYEWIEDYTDVDGSLGDHAYWCENAKNGFADTCQHEIYTCLCWSNPEDSPTHTSEIVASLGAIIDPSREYRRVVEAELALESLAA